MGYQGASIKRVVYVSGLKEPLATSNLNSYRVESFGLLLCLSIRKSLTMLTSDLDLARRDQNALGQAHTEHPDCKSLTPALHMLSDLSDRSRACTVRLPLSVWI